MFSRVCLLFSCLLTMHASVYSYSKNDSLVKFKELSFKSTEEERVFSIYNQNKDSSNYFDFLFVSYDKTQLNDKGNSLKRINDCVSYLTSQVSSKSETKKIKFIYDYVHKNFLKVYKLNNSFPDIFYKGEYNCVSASALYALIFSKMHIPYQIKETPSHVYIIAYPNSSKILIETTDPNNGYYQFNSNFINSFVANLYKSKMITKEEYESVSANELFNKYFFTSADISLFQLAGLQYSNFAIYDLDNEKRENASEEIKKACYLFQGAKSKYLLISILGSCIDKYGYENKSNVSNLIILCRLYNKDNNDIDIDIKNQFLNILEAQLIKKSDFVSFEDSYSRIIAEISDSVLLKELGFIYHYEIARVGYLNSKSQEYLLPHLQKAYVLNPLDINLHSLILAVLEKSLQKHNDTENIMNIADNFSVSFSFVKSSEYYLSIKANSFLDLAYKSFYFNNFTKAESYISNFEEFMKLNPSALPSSNFVEKAYSQAAIEYYKKGNYQKAKTLLKSGLIYAPSSFGLQQRLNQIK